MSNPSATYKCTQCGSWIDAQTGQCAAEARNRELEALLDTERAVATELRKALEGFSTTCDQLREELAMSEMTTAAVKDQRDAAREAVERLKRELREHEPRTFPMQCFLCEGQITSPDDYEWHGLGNCVPLCEACHGNGFIDMQGV